jgi:cell division protein FtsW (lipid II flippase)
MMMKSCCCQHNTGIAIFQIAQISMQAHVTPTRIFRAFSITVERTLRPDGSISPFVIRIDKIFDTHNHDLQTNLSAFPRYTRLTTTEDKYLHFEMLYTSPGEKQNDLIKLYVEQVGNYTKFLNSFANLVRKQYQTINSEIAIQQHKILVKSMPFSHSILTNIKKQDKSHSNKQSIRTSTQVPRFNEGHQS